MVTARLFDGRSALEQPVLVELDGAFLQLRGPDATLIATWPIAAINRCDGDVPGPAAVLRRHGSPERLAVADADLLQRLRDRGARLGRRRKWGATDWSGFSVALLGSIVIAAVLVDRLPSLALPLVPPALERSWASGIEIALEAGSRRCTAPAGQAALVTLISTLAHAAGIAPVPPVVVLDDQTVNAFTLPGGRLVILRGLIAKAADPDELAGVLAHELGHVARRDPTREMLRALELNMLARSLGWGGSLGSQMAALSYGRRAEAAADASAVATLRRAGLRADGLGRFFMRLQTLEGRDTRFAFLSDHPATAARIVAVQTGTAGAEPMTADAWKSIRAICD